MSFPGGKECSPIIVEGRSAPQSEGKACEKQRGRVRLLCPQMSEEAHAGCWAPDGKRKLGWEASCPSADPEGLTQSALIYKDSLGKSVETGCGVKKTTEYPVSQRQCPPSIH